MDERVEESHAHHYRAHHRYSAVLYEKACCLVYIIIGDGVEKAAQPEHADVVVVAYQIADAIDKPKKGTFGVGEIHLRRHPVHPCLAAEEEPCRVASAEDVMSVGIR